jgi:hypothetical protein
MDGRGKRNLPTKPASTGLAELNKRKNHPIRAQLIVTVTEKDVSVVIKNACIKLNITKKLNLPTK